MSLLPNLGSIGSGDSDFYKGVATTSVKFEDGNTPFLAYTPGSAGDRRKWVWAAWIKRSNQGIGDATLFGSVNAGTSQTTINILNAGAINVSSSGSGLAGISITSTNLLRDSSAWYHLAVAIDTTQGTSTNRVLVYLNGSQVTDLSATTYPNENTQTTVNEARALEIGRFNQSGVTQEFDGYLAEVNFTEGVSFFSDTSGTANSSFNINSFGVSKNGVWIPINTSGLTFGDNGFRLQFKQVGVGSGAANKIGADTSGISTPNHLTSSGIVVSDCAMPDSPENNFCLGNTIGRVYANELGNNPTYTDGALKFVTAGNSTHAFGTMAVNHFLTTGCYFEVLANRLDNDRAYVGIVDPQSSGNAASYGYVNKAMVTVSGRIFGTTAIDGSGVIPSTASTFGDDDIIGIAIKGTKFWFSVNGVYSRDVNNNVGNPSSGANAALTAITDIANIHYLPHAGYHSDWTFNFGQNPSLSGALTGGDIGTETADEGPGKFKFAVPTGFVAMCSANMEEPLIGANSDTQANDHMQAVIYEGDGSVQNIPVNFKPDLTWIKNRDATDPHQLFDSSRGVELPFDIVASSKGDSSIANDDTLTAFIATGFTLGDDDKVNSNAETYVSWNWKANGGTSTGNGAENGNNPKFDHQSNTLAGFSIVEYEGTGANGTFAHGVKVNGVATAPAVIWFKHIQGGDGWAMWHHQGNTNDSQYFPFNTANAGPQGDTNLWNGGVPSATIINLGANSLVNRNLGSPSGQGKFICYCFAEIEGYSKFSTYKGNNSANGTFVYTGFRPSWVQTKRADGGTSNWYISDTARDPSNTTVPLYNDIDTYQDGNGIDILSNGFKIRNTDTSQNADGVTYIYMAFAEQSFKYSNAR